MSSDLNNWAKKYEDLTNSDETIAAMAKYYSCSFMFDMEKAKVIIEMHDGKVKNINIVLQCTYKSLRFSQILDRWLQHFLYLS